MLILAGLAAIATTLSDSVVVGQVFSVGLVAVLGVLLAASAAVLAGLAVLFVEDAAASAFVGAAWVGESVSSGESFGCAAGGAGDGRDADHDGLSGAEGCGVGAAYLGCAESAECFSDRYYEQRGWWEYERC